MSRRRGALSGRYRVLRRSQLGAECRAARDGGDIGGPRVRRSRLASADGSSGVAKQSSSG
jgi:hypothetical protein